MLALKTWISLIGAFGLLAHTAAFAELSQQQIDAVYAAQQQNEPTILSRNSDGSVTVRGELLEQELAPLGLATDEAELYWVANEADEARDASLLQGAVVSFQHLTGTVYESGSAVFTRRDDGLYEGEVFDLSGTYAIVADAEGNRLVQPSLDTPTHAGDYFDYQDTLQRRGDAGQRLTVLGALEQQGSGESATIDVLVLLSAEHGGQYNWLDYQLPRANATLNNAFERQGIPARFEIIGQEEVTYFGTGDLHRDLDNAIYSRGFSGETVQQKAARYGADITVLVVRDGNYCGVAPLLAKRETAITVIKGSCLHWGHGYAHEIGHLLGAGHNPEDGKGVFDYSHGHYAASGAFRTIMAYQRAGAPTSSYPLIPYFSDPNTLIGSNQEPAGSAKADNVRTIRQFVTRIANLRQRTDGGAAPAATPSQPTEPAPKKKSGGGSMGGAFIVGLLGLALFGRRR